MTNQHNFLHISKIDDLLERAKLVIETTEHAWLLTQPQPVEACPPQEDRPIHRAKRGLRGKRKGYYFAYPSLQY